MRAIPQKIHILKFIGEQGVVTISDITRHFSCPDKYSYIRIALYKLGLAHVKYLDIHNGIWFIDNPDLYDLLRSYYPDFPQLEARLVGLGRVPHCLELNHIRTTLTHTHRITIDNWWSERCLWSLPLSKREEFCGDKIPDAIFWHKRRDGSRQKYFLEYERTLKSKDRYDEIFRTYARRRDVNNRNVIYICQTLKIKRQLENIEERLVRSGRLSDIGQYFQFVTLESFYKSHSNPNPIKEEAHHEENQNVYANV